MAGSIIFVVISAKHWLVKEVVVVSIVFIVCSCSVTINVTRVGNNDGVKIDITNGGTDNDGVTTNVINYGANCKRQQWCNTKCYK